MTAIPPHRHASGLAFVLALLIVSGRIDAAHCQLVRLTSWIVLQQGAGRE